VLAVLLAALTEAGCAQFGVPDVPAFRAEPDSRAGGLFLVYDPWAVLGFGHSGLIVADPEGEGFLRYDQYASSEIRYERAVARGTAGILDGFLERLPPFAGFTREYVTRLAAPHPQSLVGAVEYMIPIPAESGAAARVAVEAETRFRSASVLEAETARRYYLFTNNCQTFVRDLLTAGGLSDPPYFPKWHVEALLRERGRDAKPGGS
jgi:hypothetical protein